MRVAIPATDRDLDAPTDPRFGRCQVFMIVETDDMSFQALDNDAALQGSGAGIAAVQLVANAGADAVIAAHLGPNAFSALNAGGLKVYNFAGGTVRQAVEALKAGQLPETGGANVPSHFGMGGGGRGMGMGRGMGLPPSVGRPQQPVTDDARKQVQQKVASLEAQLKDLREQLDRLSGKGE